MPPDQTHRPDTDGLVAGPLTASESLIWAGQRLDPDSPLYNMAMSITIDGPLDAGALRRAYRRLVDASDTLRTVFVESGGRPRRVVRDVLDADLEVIEAGDADAESLARMLESRARRPFVLDEALTDLCLVRAGPRSILYLNQHHLVTDAWSTGILYRRLADLYLEETGGEAAGPLEIPQYADYVAHALGLEDSPRLAEARDHWDAGASTSSAVRIYGHAGPGTGRTERLRVALGRERTARLREAADTAPFRGLTAEQSRFQVFATALLAWLARVSDRRHVSIGTPWHNRPTGPLRETPGLFIELYPLRVAVEADATFRDLGEQVAARIRETLRYVVPGASASPGARGYGAVLNYITADLGNFAGLAARADWIHPGAGDPAHKIRLQVHDFDVAGAPTLDFDLDVETFAGPTREWATRHFFALFDALTGDPDAGVFDVPLTNEDEERAFAPRGASTPAPPDVLTLFRRQVAERPHAIAVAEGKETTTYAGLDARARWVSDALRGAGVRPGDVVGVCLSRSAGQVAALLGVHGAGAAFLPLEPGHPDERLAGLIEDAGAGCVLVDAVAADRIRGTGATPIIVAGAGSAAAADARFRTRSGSSGGPDPTPDGLAYVLYTSGSTGRPKGVEVTHEALARYVTWARRVYAPQHPPRFAYFTSPAFDLTLTSIFVPLVSGGTIVAYPGDPADSGLLVRQVFEEGAVDTVKLTPSQLALVRDLDLADSPIQCLILGGENLARTAALAAHGAFGGDVEIFNEYGPTEATVGCMIHRFDPDVDTGPSVPIGVPADDVRIHVLDAAGRLAPRGVTGEICIAGPRLARGYRDRPDLTAAAFAPIAGEPRRRVYHSGDLGRWRADGTLEFLGRTDGQVKVRGVRIELAEVEAALSTHPAVERCAAALIRGSGSRRDRCARCGLEATHPAAHLDRDGVCGPCRRFERERERVASYFGTMEELATLLQEARSESRGPHDTIMLYSGGKDSTYALCRIVELGANPLVFLLDNGFISDQAKANVRRVVETLGLDLVVGETPAMPAIFADSLHRHSDVCNGCFKTIYTLAAREAVERGIPAIVTGLSRGQIFHTRLSDLYRRGIYDPDDVDRTILEARKAYHRMDDAVARSLDVRLFETDDVLDRLRFIDFYRYCDASLEEILEYVGRRTPWIRPSDTGRSTNCLINEAGIFVHLSERGFHNYAMPYSWDVRLGHKRRDAALEELDDRLDPARVRGMLDAVGYRERPAPSPEARLAVYYTTTGDPSHTELRAHLARSLPAEAIPARLLRLEALPLTESGKVDRDALPEPRDERPALGETFVPPRTDVERQLAHLWGEVLGLGEIGVHDDFFELGGDSMHCIQIVSAALENDLAFQPRDLFANPTVAALARVATRAGTPGAVAEASATEDELALLEREFGG